MASPPWCPHLLHALFGYQPTFLSLCVRPHAPHRSTRVPCPCCPRGGGVAGFVSKYPRLQTYGVDTQHSAVELVGAPDWDACQQLVAAVVNATAACGAGSHISSGGGGSGGVAAGRHCVLGTVQPQLQASADWSQQACGAAQRLCAGGPTYVGM